MKPATLIIICTVIIATSIILSSIILFSLISNQKEGINTSATPYLSASPKATSSETPLVTSTPTESAATISTTPESSIPMIIPTESATYTATPLQSPQQTQVQTEPVTPTPFSTMATLSLYVNITTIPSSSSQPTSVPVAGPYNMTSNHITGLVQLSHSISGSQYYAGDVLVLTAIVSDGSANMVVTIYDVGFAVGSAKVATAQTNQSGVATFTLPINGLYDTFGDFDFYATATHP